MNPNVRFPIEHVIVLMLENRSYDHMLGYLPNGHGLTGNEFNPVDPSDPNSERVPVSNKAGYISVDPAHDFESVETQLYGKPGHIANPAPMDGFVAAHIVQEKGDVELGKKIMECFDPAKLPALTTLANEFCLCDHWFSAVPGPTWLNRFFAHSATCDGMIVDTPRHNYRMKTIFDALGKNGYSWNIYYGDVPQSIVLQHHWRTLDRFKRFENYFADLEKGELAAYSFIEPRYIDFHEWKATDQHPPHDVRRLVGEYLSRRGLRFPAQ
jgi:Phospholipase C